MEEVDIEFRFVFEVVREGIIKGIGKIDFKAISGLRKQYNIFSKYLLIFDGKRIVVSIFYVIIFFKRKSRVDLVKFNLGKRLEESEFIF